MSAAGLDIAILVHDLSATGVVHNAIRIANAAAESGRRCELWVIRPDGAFSGRLHPAVKVRRIDTLFAVPVRRFETLLSIGPLARLIIEYGPRVLLSAGNHFHLASGLAYARAGRPATVRFMGRASNATPKTRLPLIAGLASFADAFKYREMNPVIAVSRELAGDLAARLGIPPARIAVIPNGVDIAAIEARAAEPLDDPWFADGGPPVIVSAGRLSRQKNYELLIAAFAMLRQRQAARLIILGDGSPKKRAALEAQIARLGLAADVRLHGFEANPMRYFAASALFVLSSRWEGASNVLLEAMACGCPIVATDCPTGVREQLDGGRLGPLVPSGDVRALANAMTARLALPRNSDALRDQARRFDHATMLEAYLKLFAEAR